MPSMGNMLKSKKSKSCSALENETMIAVSLNDGDFKMSTPLAEVPTKGPRRSSFGLKAGYVLGRSLRKLMARRSSEKNWPPSADKIVLEDSTCDIASNPSWELASTTDTSIAATPPRARNIVGVVSPVMEDVAELVASPTAAPEDLTELVEGETAVLVESTQESVYISMPDAEDTGDLEVEPWVANFAMPNEMLYSENEVMDEAPQEAAKTTHDKFFEGQIEEQVQSINESDDVMPGPPKTSIANIAAPIEMMNSDEEVIEVALFATEAEKRGDMEVESWDANFAMLKEMLGSEIEAMDDLPQKAANTTDDRFFEGQIEELVQSINESVDVMPAGPKTSSASNAAPAEMMASKEEVIKVALAAATMVADEAFNEAVAPSTYDDDAEPLVTEHLEKDSETTANREASFPALLDQVTQPPCVRRNKELLDLLNEANYGIAVDSEVAVEGEKVLKLLEEPLLEAIDITKEPDENETDQLENKEGTASETSSQWESESALEGLTTSSLCDSIVTAKSVKSVKSASHVGSSTVVAVLTAFVVAASLAVMIFHVKMDGFNLINRDLPSFNLDLQLIVDDFRLSHIELPSVDFGALKSIKIGGLRALDWKELRAEVHSLFSQVEEAAGEEVASAIRIPSVLEGGCYGSYCSF